MQLFHRRRPHRAVGRRFDLRADRRGAVAIMLALLALPLIGIVGLGVDYGFAIRAESLLNSAADSAAVAATNTAANAANQPNVTSAEIIAQGQAAGTQIFNAQIANLTRLTTPVVTVTVSQPNANSATFVTAVSYTASYSTFFGKIFNAPVFPLSGNSSAQISLTAFEDFHILMDTSGSMSIASTAADMARLGPMTLAASNAAANNTAPFNTTYNGKSSSMNGAAQGTNCAFGCHFDNSGTNCTNCDFYEIAKHPTDGNPTVPVTLRIDLEQDAVAQVITTMQQQDSISQYRVGVYGFNTALTHVYPTGQNFPTTDLADGAAAASAMQQPWSNPGNEPNTNFGAAMTTLAAGMNCANGISGTYIPCPGDGSTQAKAQEFLFIITDGIEDYNGPGGRVIQPIQQSECAALKAQGVQILVLYVQYVPLDTSYNGISYYNSFYVGNVQSYVDPGGVVSASNQVQTNLQACASQTSQLFFASDSTQIGTQLKAMLIAAESQGVRLTQ